MLHIALRAYFEENPNQRVSFTDSQLEDATAALKAHPGNSPLLLSKLETHIPEIAAQVQVLACAHAIRHGV